MRIISQSVQHNLNPLFYSEKRFSNKSDNNAQDLELSSKSTNNLFSKLFKKKEINENPHQVLKFGETGNKIASLIATYSCYDENATLLNLKRVGRVNDGGYVVPELAVQKADACIGYGISDDISFERQISKIYNIPSYGFDGTCSPIDTKHKLCKFIRQSLVSQDCIDGKIPFPKGIGKGGSFEQHLDRLNLKDKKVFIKMDIEGNEYSTMPDILKHSHNITGIVLEVHFNNAKQSKSAKNLLEKINENFLLVHVHGNNCCKKLFVTENSKGKIPCAFELSYINKNLVENSNLSADQSHPKRIDMPNNPKIKDCKFTILLNKQSV